MSDIKLFDLRSGRASEVASSSVQVEKSLQKLFEDNLETLLGVRLLASEHSTGPVHGGRIDTLGIDEDGCPVIIEYKRAVNENVINQGLYYLDWLMDHRKDLQWLVLERLGQQEASKVDWTSPRLICIAGDFTRYDAHAVKQINRNIELLRYRRFEGDLLMIELLHGNRTLKAISVKTEEIVAPLVDSATPAVVDPYLNSRIDYRLNNTDPALRDLFDAISDYLIGLGDDIMMKELKYYIAFKRIKNFVCLEVYPQTKAIMAYLKLSPSAVPHVPGFTRDVSKIGHFGTGDLELTIRSQEDFERAQVYFQAAYERG